MFAAKIFALIYSTITLTRNTNIYLPNYTSNSLYSYWKTKSPGINS